MQTDAKSKEVKAKTGLVVILNGPAGVGKTTVGRRLAATARNGICIHGDDLKRFVVARDAGTVEGGLSYVGAAALADIFLVAGYELVVVEFVFPTGRQVTRFVQALRSMVPVHLLTLRTSLATVVAREASRSDRERLDERVSAGWEEMEENLGDLGVVVDASGSPDEITIQLRRHINKGISLLPVGQLAV